MRASHIAIVALLSLLSFNAGARELLVSLADPAGDDVGSGELIYPRRGDFTSGNLDLRRVDIERDGDGFWFTVAFANPIRSPAMATTGIGPDPESLANKARLGFYQMNIDIYVDTDRTAASGNTFTLPGRKVRIDSAYAWERAIALTPRPDLMRGALLDALNDQFPSQPAADAEAMIDQTIFFPRNVKVQGKQIIFYVPASFFGASDGRDWAVTALVTGAKPFEGMRLGFTSSNKTPVEELEMGVMQPQFGNPENSFGTTAQVLPSPVVDLLAPSREHQIGLLGSMVPLTGVSWGIHAANEARLAPRSVVIAPVRADRQNSEDSFFSNPFGALRRMLRDDDPPPRKQPMDADAAKRYLDTKMNPQTGTAAERGTPPSPPNTPRADLPVRMQTLKRLLDDGLISPSDYEQQKKRLLGEL